MQMKKQLLIQSIACFALSVPSLAQTQMGFSGPVSGVYFADTQKAVLPIRGIPGSAMFADPFLAGVDNASISPDGNRAVVERKGAVSLIDGLRSPSPTLTALSALASFNLVSWSADSTKAIINSTDAGLVLVDGSTVETSEKLQLSSGSITSLAISNSGNVVVSAKGSGVFFARRGQGFELVTQLDAATSIVLDGKQFRGFVLDNATNLIQAFEISAGAQNITSIPLAAAEGSEYAGLAQSKDGLWLLALNRGLKQVEVYNIATGGLDSKIALDFNPTQFQRIAGGDLFALSATGLNQALYVLDTTAQFRISFIPAMPNLSAEEF